MRQFHPDLRLQHLRRAVARLALAAAAVLPLAAAAPGGSSSGSMRTDGAGVLRSEAGMALASFAL